MVMSQTIELDRPARTSVADGSLRLRLSESFRSNGLFANHEVRCDDCDGVVVLCGRVQSFHEKQMAQELARKVDGVKIVVNRLAVDRSRFATDVSREIPLKTGVRPSGEIR
jgi:osmotically-inducible protein OsmY